MTRLHAGLALSGLIAVLAVIGIADATSAAPAREQGAAALYRRYGCYQCHGLAGQGSIMSGPALAGRALLPDRIMAYARAPAGVMPPYRAAILSDADLSRIAAYVSALPAGRPASKIALLAGYRRAAGVAPVAPRAEPANAASSVRPPAPGASSVAQGMALYAGHCAICHGANRTGGVGPDLRGEAGKRALERTVQLLLDPPGAMPKLSPDPLSIAQMRIIAEYVRAP